MKLIKNGQQIDSSELVSLYPHLAGPNVASEQGWEPVWPTTPEYDPITQYPHEIAPVKDIKGIWRQTWSIATLDTDTIAANQAAAAITAAAAAQAAQDVTDIAAVKDDATVRYLTTHTPAQCYTKVQTDVTDLASAKVMLGRLAMALSVIGRNTLR